MKKILLLAVLALVGCESSHNTLGALPNADALYVAMLNASGEGTPSQGDLPSCAWSGEFAQEVWGVTSSVDTSGNQQFLETDYTLFDDDDPNASGTVEVNGLHMALHISGYVAFDDTASHNSLYSFDSENMLVVGTDDLYAVGYGTVIERLTIPQPTINKIFKCESLWYTTLVPYNFSVLPEVMDKYGYQGMKVAHPSTLPE